jgi:integrase/recombinase XerD
MKRGSLTYQTTCAFKRILALGKSRHELKKQGIAYRRITSFDTMKSYLDISIKFAKWCKQQFSIKNIAEINPEHAEAYIQEFKKRGVSGGYLGKIICAIRKFDIAMREAKIKPAGSPPLLKGIRGFHSPRRPENAYSTSQAKAIIRNMKKHARDPQTATVVSLMLHAGLRVREAVNLRKEDIQIRDPSTVIMRIEKGTKGGQIRKFEILDEESRSFLKKLWERSEEGDIFKNKKGLASKTKDAVRHACDRLGVPLHGTHGFRRTFAQRMYLKLRSEGISEQQARLLVANALGHHRIEVTYSYIPRFFQ